MVGVIGRPCESKYVKKIPEKFINSIKNRFYAKVLIPDENGCMIWNGAKSKKGYGGFVGHNKKMTNVHRYSYSLYNGVIPTGMSICHTCDNPSCVAPNHLFAGTQKENVHDMLRKKRGKDNSGIKNGMSKLTEEKVSLIKKHIKENILSLIEIGELFEISPPVISSIKHGRAWKNKEGF